jgi:hypothetical protein
VTRLVVAAVLLLAAAAAGDALRGRAEPDPREDGRAPPPAQLVASHARGFAVTGERLDDRVLLHGEAYLGREALADAFPAPVGGPIHVGKLAAAADGTLALGIYRFPSAQPLERAVELWRDGRLLGAFTVPPGYFSGGLAVSRDGTVVATFGHDGALRGVFDRRGRRLPALPASFPAD